MVPGDGEADANQQLVGNTAAFAAWVKANGDYHQAADPATVLSIVAENKMLAVLLDNVVISQSLSKALRQAAYDEARSYLYTRRQALQAGEKG